MKSLMLLWQVVADELATWCDTSATHDVKTVMSRVEQEGLSFLTITLPSFASDFQKSLDEGKVDPSLYAGFSRRGKLPKFLGGFMDTVFDRSSGSLLEVPSIDSIFAIRQLTLMFGKIGLPCSQERTDNAIEGYLQCEQEVRAGDSERTEDDLLQFSRIALLLYGNMYDRVDLRISRGDIKPKHGPGSTARRILGNKKYDALTWTERLEDAGLYSRDLLVTNDRDWRRLQAVRFLEPGAETPVRVITVPKTLKTPRIIAIEPEEMQYTQQALLECILEEMGRDDILSSFLGFDDQIPNQDLARIGSREGSLATLDLSEASDRVSNQHVRAMLRYWPSFQGAVEACRSRKADVPGFGSQDPQTIRLAKFASMGSALCFPFEAMVFLTLILKGIAPELSDTRLSRGRRIGIIRSLMGLVRVYGDDIIVPVEHVSSVVRELENFGFRVNASKSFWTGKFRESCGKDYYDGYDVSIARVRSPLLVEGVLPRQQRASDVLSTVSLRNQLYQLGLWKTCQWMDNHIEKSIRHFPMVLPTSPVVGRHSVLGYAEHKMHPTLHSPLVKGWVVSAPLPIDKLDGEGALLKFHLKRGLSPSQDGHLDRAGRPSVVNLKLRYASSV